MVGRQLSVHYWCNVQGMHYTIEGKLCLVSVNRIQNLIVSNAVLYHLAALVFSVEYALAKD